MVDDTKELPAVRDTISEEVSVGNTKRFRYSDDVALETLIVVLVTLLERFPIRVDSVCARYIFVQDVIKQTGIVDLIRA